MSYKAVEWVRCLRSVTPTQKLLLFVIADRVKDGEWVTWAGQEALAADGGVSERCVRSTLRDLERVGIVEREHRRRPDGYRTSDAIRLNIGWEPSSQAEGSPEPGSPEGDSGGSDQQVEAHRNGVPRKSVHTSPANERQPHRNEVPRGDRKLEPEVEPNPSAPPALVLVPDLPSAEDIAAGRFDEHFWPAWPSRNGKKLSKSKALGYWLKLSVDEQRAALRGARNYAAASRAGMAGAKDAFRWLRDREWPDWQDPARPDGNTEQTRASFPEASARW